MVVKSTPQILKRVSVRWLPDPAYEDTETTSLNVRGYYLDVRVAKADGSLQWSRAGERKQLGTDPLTFQWTRIIDSFGSCQADEAAFTALPDGDDLEYGTYNKDGVPTSYEEVWRDVTPQGTDGEACAWICQSKDGLALVGKVSDHFIGMRQCEDGGFAVTLEVFDDSKGEWQTKFEAGMTKFIPKAAAVLESGIETLVKTDGSAAGDTVVISGIEYVIRGIENL